MINTGEPMSQRDSVPDKIKTFNELAAAFKRCLADNFNIKGYISL
jgi:hypothetical protein